MGDEYIFPKLWGVFSQDYSTGSWHCERIYSDEEYAVAGSQSESQQVIELEVMRSGTHSSLFAAWCEAKAEAGMWKRLARGFDRDGEP